MTIAPARQWWTTEELAASGLPDLPRTRQGVDQLVEREGWREDGARVRRRSGRGGGWEYHWQLLPLRARTALLRQAAAGTPAPDRAPADRGAAWRWFDGLPEAVRAVARARLDAVREVEALERALTRQVAVGAVAARLQVSGRTVWNWLAACDGIDPADRLPALAPRHRAAPERARTAEGSPEFMDWLKGDYLRLEGPSFNASYDVACRLAAARGLAVLTLRTARRRLDEQVPRVTQVFAREGIAGLERCYPPQRRDRTAMVALEGVNADCHKIDVFVAWPDVERPVRPQIVAFQDIFSGKILSWRVDRDPNKVAVMAAFGEMVETWGIPRHVLFDNGREFANKWLTGGTKTRFRFAIRDDDPLGVLPQMGIAVHWARPAHGQSKPVERAFRDVADRVARDPRLAGAWVGNRPDAKPENYGSRAVPLDTFLDVLAQGIADHNARPGRLSDTARGRSFDETFAESYATAPIVKAVEEQRRLWLMGQEVRQLHRGHGQLSMHGGEYWSDWMSEHAGQRVVARFDPENLHAGVHVYGLDGAFMGFAECRVKAPFFDLASARAQAREEARRRREQRRLLDAARPLSAADVGRALDAVARVPPVVPEAKVVQLAQAARRGPLVERPLPVPDQPSEAAAARHTALIAEFRQRPAEPAADAAAETRADRFRRAREIARRSEAGEPVGTAEADWFAVYSGTPEYRSLLMLWEDFGDAAIR